MPVYACLVLCEEGRTRAYRTEAAARAKHPAAVPTPGVCVSFTGARAEAGAYTRPVFSSRRTVAVDANNALLLRLDEWAVCCALVPGDVAEAGGERGGVPQEHRNGPSRGCCRG